MTDTAQTVGIATIAVLALNWLGKVAMEKLKPAANGNGMATKVAILEKEVEKLREWRHEMSSVKQKTEDMYDDFIERRG